MAHLLPALFAGLVAAWAAGASWLVHEARAVLRHVPAAVAELLREQGTRDALIRLVLQVAAYANLSKEERRRKALDLVETWLENHGIRLTDQELATLVELLYAWVKKVHPHRIAPEPVSLGGADTRSAA